ncbi:PREDICTED: uncharacterized protein LOC105967875, partial [Erythranthe guttata]|uniref:uncharacterized protein LOC105967875 n=1 Tax=Erythranthe guttata TaxID=4155 RepID=UPI00064D7E45
YFWHDHWFGDGPLSGIIDGGRLTSVRVEYYLVNGQWDRNKLAEDIPFEWIDRICSVPISGASGDLPIWRASSDGKNDSKHKDITVRASSIIYRVIQHIRILHQTKLLSADSWTGIPHVAESLGLYYRVRTPTLTPHRVVWLPPDPGWVKLNTDGARRASTQIAAIGGIIRGSDAEAILAFHERISAPSSIAAELAALASGLRFVIQRQFTRVWIELDAEVAVRLLSHTDQGHWSLQSSLTVIRNSLSTLEYRITHIYREGKYSS